LAVHNADHLSHQLVAGKYRILAAINPMTGIIEAFRFTVIPGKQLDIWLLMFSIGISLLMFVIGLIYFRKTEREFADIV
jgi:lipopolysaccharide transport system permease protein